MHELLISVCIPAFNAEKTLVRCVSSVLEQKYANCEVIIVDDGSTDNTPNICSDLAVNYANVTVLHQENRGQIAARNKAVSKAKGQWVLFLDSDDELESNSFQLLSAAIEETDADIIFFGGTNVDFAGNKTPWREKFPDATAEINRIPKNDILVKLLTGAGLGSMFCQIVKADLAHAALKDESMAHLRYREDTVQNISLYSKAEAFAYLKAPIYLHIENSESLTHNVDPEKYWADWQEMRRAIREFASKVSLNEETRIEVEHGMLTDDARNIILAASYVHALSVVRAKEFLKSIRASTLFQGIKGKKGLELSWRQRIAWMMLSWHLDSLFLFSSFLRAQLKNLKNPKPSKK